MSSGQRPFRSKIDWGELRPLLLYVAFFGTLLVMPLWSRIVLRESNGWWASVVAVIVGLAALIARGISADRCARKTRATISCIVEAGDDLIRGSAGTGRLALGGNGTFL